MKKILFICYMNLNDKGTIGIRKKIISQISTLSAIEGASVDYIWREGCRLNSNINKINGIECKNADALNAFLVRAELNYDFCYIRFNRFSLKFVSALKKLKNKGSKIIVEIPTYPFFKEDWDEFLRSIKRVNIINSAKVLIKMIENSILPRFSKGYIDRIATYSKDNSIWYTRTLQISNGIKIEPLDNTINNENDSIVLICVSSCLKWHGYDRLLYGMANYYKKKKASRWVKLIIVGDGPEISNYKKIVSDYSLSDFVTLKGAVHGDDLKELYALSNIAIDALGRHRVGVYYNSSLKGKEYAERGLPIVSGVETEFDKDKNYMFYFRVPADDSPIKIEDIIGFYNKIQEIDNYRVQIHSYASDNFSYNIAMKSIIDYIVD